MTPLPRWVAPLLIVVALALAPWTLYLTYSLPAQHVTGHWDVAWIGFDVALLAAFAVTGWCAIRQSRWLIPAAAMTGTMLVCDAWFDVVTARGGSERLEAILEACLVELPLAAICAYIVWDAERFQQALLGRRRKVLDQPETVFELRDP